MEGAPKLKIRDNQLFIYNQLWVLHSALNYYKNHGNT